MGTKILNDIHDDLKLLITAITGFEVGEEGFRVCERFALSNIKHHRYLSVDSHATKRAINDVAEKFSVHGKYEVSKKFQDLVGCFLTSFDFEQHPQYDLQWSLLSLLLNLSNETSKSELNVLGNLKSTRGEHSFNVTVADENFVTEEIDWAQYLKEGQEDFFCDYRSDTESEWSNEEDSESKESIKTSFIKPSIEDLAAPLPIKRTQSTLEKLSQSLADEVESRNWLEKNIQGDRWNEIEWRQYRVDSRFPDASLCELWDRTTLQGIQVTGTLSEYQICRELLWMCHSQTRMTVFQQKNELEFIIRPNVSIPSLTSAAFYNILVPFCDYFFMLREIEQFGESLYPKYDKLDVYQRPPLTYEAYNRAVTKHLATFRNGIVEIEKKFMNQDDCDTLLSLSKEMKKYLHGVKMLYEVHQAITNNWELSLNWKCASKLLSGLFFEMQNSSSTEKANMCCSLYLQSLSVYLNIIDTWLSEGRFEDWRDEFVIAKVPEDVTMEDDGQQQKFIVRQLDAICTEDPVMQLLVHRVRHMGRSIELLVSLDRIPDMWRMINVIDAPRISLNDEFLDKVTLEFSKYDFSESMDTTDFPTNKITEIASIIPIDSDIEQNVLQQMSNMDNPFLMKAFEEYLPIDVFRRDSVDGECDKSSLTMRTDEMMFERLENITRSVLPSRKILENVLSIILDVRYEGASKLVKDIMIKEYKLEAHLKLMRCVYMMETGHVMNKFYQLLFTEIESNPMWNNSYFLTNILEEILSQEWPDSSSRWSIIVQDVRTFQVLQAVDNIALRYAVGWPVNMVLNEIALEKYNGIFRFQLKLKWALWTLDNLKFGDLESSKSTHMLDKMQHFHVRRLECLRFWLIHAIGSIHAYLSGQVLQTLGLMLEKTLAQADNLDTIMTVHNEYLDKVHEHCLQTLEFEDLTATINSLLEMCMHVRDRWKRGAVAIIASELDVMESSYIKYHTYLALALQNAVQHKDADYYKLTPRYQICTEDEDSRDSEDEKEVFEDHEMTELSRNLLTEVAHQTLPPSGIPVPIPKVMLIREKGAFWNYQSSQLQSPEQLIEYEQTFSYLRWYHYEEHLNTMNSKAYALCDELDDLIKDTESEDNNLGAGCHFYNSIGPIQNSQSRQSWQDRLAIMDTMNIQETESGEFEGSQDLEEPPKLNELRVLGETGKFKESQEAIESKEGAGKNENFVDNSLRSHKDDHPKPWIDNLEHFRIKRLTKSKETKASKRLSNKNSPVMVHLDKNRPLSANYGQSKTQMGYLETFRTKNSIKSNDSATENVEKLLDLSKSRTVSKTEEHEKVQATTAVPKKNFIKMNRRLSLTKTEPKDKPNSPTSPMGSRRKSSDRKTTSKPSQIPKFTHTIPEYQIPVKRVVSPNRKPTVGRKSGSNIRYGVQNSSATENVKPASNTATKRASCTDRRAENKILRDCTEKSKLNTSSGSSTSNSQIPTKTMNKGKELKVHDYSRRPKSQGSAIRKSESKGSSDTESYKSRKNIKQFELGAKPRGTQAMEILHCRASDSQEVGDSSETDPDNETEMYKNEFLKNRDAPFDVKKDDWKFRYNKGRQSNAKERSGSKVYNIKKISTMQVFDENAEKFDTGKQNLNRDSNSTAAENNCCSESDQIETDENCCETSCNSDRDQLSKTNFDDIDSNDAEQSTNDDSNYANKSSHDGSSAVGSRKSSRSNFSRKTKSSYNGSEKYDYARSAGSSVSYTSEKISQDNMCSGQKGDIEKLFDKLKGRDRDTEQSAREIECSNFIERSDNEYVTISSDDSEIPVGQSCGVKKKIYSKYDSIKPKLKNSKPRSELVKKNSRGGYKSEVDTLREIKRKSKIQVPPDCLDGESVIASDKAVTLHTVNEFSSENDSTDDGPAVSTKNGEPFITGSSNKSFSSGSLYKIYEDRTCVDDSDNENSEDWMKYEDSISNSKVYCGNSKSNDSNMEVGNRSGTIVTKEPYTTSSTSQKKLGPLLLLHIQSRLKECRNEFECSINSKDSNSSFLSTEDRMENVTTGSHPPNDGSHAASLALNEIDAGTQCQINFHPNDDEESMDSNGVENHCPDQHGQKKLIISEVTQSDLDMNICGNLGILSETSLILMKIDLNENYGVGSLKNTDEIHTNFDLNINICDSSTVLHGINTEPRYPIARNKRADDESKPNITATNSTTMFDVNINISKETPIDRNHSDDGGFATYRNENNADVGGPIEANEYVNGKTVLSYETDTETQGLLDSNDNNSDRWVSANNETDLNIKNADGRSSLNSFDTSASHKRRINNSNVNSKKKIKPNSKKDYRNADVYEKLRDSDENTKIIKKRSRSKLDINVLYQRNCRVKPTTDYMNYSDKMPRGHFAQRNSDIETDQKFECMSENDANSPRSLKSSDVTIDKIIENFSGNHTNSMTPLTNSDIERKTSSDTNDSVSGATLRKTVDKLNLIPRKIPIQKSSKDSNSMLLTLKKSSLNNKIALKVSPKNTVKCAAVKKVSKPRNSVFCKGGAFKDSFSNGQSVGDNRSRKYNVEYESSNIQTNSANLEFLPVEKQGTTRMHATPLELSNNALFMKLKNDRTIAHIMAPKKHFKDSEKSDSKESARAEKSTKNITFDRQPEQRQTCIIS